MKESIDLGTEPKTPRPERNWRDHAACRRYDPEMWFADDSPTRDAATLICVAECPVQQECLDAELAIEGPAGWRNRYGIRGGLNGTERYAIHLRNTRQARKLRETA